MSPSILTKYFNHEYLTSGKESWDDNVSPQEAARFETNCDKFIEVLWKILESIQSPRPIRIGEVKSNFGEYHEDEQVTNFIWNLSVTSRYADLFSSIGFPTLGDQLHQLLVEINYVDSTTYISKFLDKVVCDLHAHNVIIDDNIDLIDVSGNAELITKNSWKFSFEFKFEVLK